jgi:hypothetical protein
MMGNPPEIQAESTREAPAAGRATGRAPELLREIIHGIHRR